MKTIVYLKLCSIIFATYEMGSMKKNYKTASNWKISQTKLVLWFVCFSYIFVKLEVRSFNLNQISLKWFLLWVALWNSAPTLGPNIGLSPKMLICDLEGCVPMARMFKNLRKTKEIDFSWFSWQSEKEFLIFHAIYTFHEYSYYSLVYHHWRLGFWRSWGFEDLLSN